MPGRAKTESRESASEVSYQQGCIMLHVPKASLDHRADEAVRPRIACHSIVVVHHYHLASPISRNAYSADGHVW